MGSGIAQVAAAHGHAVILSDASESAVARARTNITGALDKLVDKGKLDRQSRDETLGNITFAEKPPGADYSRFRDCALVIEAIVEDIGVKKELFRALDSVVAPEAILASNTSS